MSSAVATFKPRRSAPSLASAETRERWVRRRVGTVWGLLILNAITFTAGAPLLVPIPHRIGEILSQGSLPLALLLALTVNRARDTPQRLPLPGKPARHRSGRDDLSARALRHHVPDLPVG